MTPYESMTRYIGVREIAGPNNNGLIQFAHSLCGLDPETPDETPWCSSFLNMVVWHLRLPRSKSAAARSWLEVGTPISLADARPGYDVVIFKRGADPQPGPEVTRGAPGHVGLYAGEEGSSVLVLGGNQSNSVSIARYPAKDVLGVRRLSAAG